jgi:hypothetical protein
VLACRVVETDEFARWCRRCGCEAAPRDSVTRRLAHEPLGWRPTTLLITIRRYRCTGCGHVWRQDTSRAAEPRAKLSRRALRWALAGIVCQHLTVARVAEGLGVSWNTANDAVLAQGRRVLIEDPHRFDGVRVIGVDEHCWRHTRRGDKYVTVIIDLTPIRDGTGPARLLDMVEGRSKQVFKAWLGERDTSWRDGIEVVAMDGFTGFKTATNEELPDAVAVTDPFHVVRLEDCRRSAEFLSEPDEKAFRPADVAEPNRVFVLDHFAADELRAVLTEPGERLVDVVHHEHDAQVAESVHRGVPVIGDHRRREKARELEPAVTVRRAHHGDLDALVAQSSDAPCPLSFHHGSPFELEAELAKERDRRW